MDQDTINRLALKAGAAKFYPERQTTKDDAYIVGQGFLEKFAAEVQAAATAAPTLDMARVSLTDAQIADLWREYPYHIADARNAVDFARIVLAARMTAQPDPATQWDDPRVQRVYELLCGDEAPPAEQHWEGWIARRIVDALAAATAAQQPLGEEQREAEFMRWNLSPGAHEHRALPEHQREAAAFYAGLDAAERAHGIVAGAKATGAPLADHACAATGVVDHGAAATAAQPPALADTARVPDDFRNQASGYRAGWNDCRGVALTAATAAQPDTVPVPRKMLQAWAETMNDAATYVNIETRSPAMERECKGVRDEMHAALAGAKATGASA